jgi:hypothetical protein
MLFIQKRFNYGVFSLIFILALTAIGFVINVLFEQRGIGRWQGNGLYDIGIIIYFILSLIIWSNKTFDGSRYMILIITMVTALIFDLSFMRYMGLVPLFLLQDSWTRPFQRNMNLSILLVGYHLIFAGYSLLFWYR